MSLCSGVGMLDLGLEWAGMRTVQVCEIDPWCRSILGQRFPGAAVHDDVWTIEPVACDVVAAGFPCTPFSTAGHRKGVDDDEWLWPAVESVVRRVRPRYVILENVPSLADLALDVVLGDLAALGFDAEWTVFRAADVGALHVRRRMWVVATRDPGQSAAWDDAGGFYAPGWGSSALSWSGLRPQPEAVADTHQGGRPRGAGSERETRGRHELADVGADPRQEAWRISEPRMDRSPDGCPLGVDRPGRTYPARWLDGTWEDGVNRTTTETGNRARRLSALGNGVVPQCVELIGYRIRQLDGAA